MTADPIEQHACQGENCDAPDSGSQVQGCEAWDQYLCSRCRYLRNEAELRMTLAERQAAGG